MIENRFNIIEISLILLSLVSRITCTRRELRKNVQEKRETHKHE